MKYSEMLDVCKGNEDLGCIRCKYNDECREFINIFGIYPFTMKYILANEITPIERKSK